jgi:hypothetical protein
MPIPALFREAAASLHGITVVAADSGDFGPARVRVFNPWADHEPSAD